MASKVPVLLLFFVRHTWLGMKNAMVNRKDRVPTPQKNSKSSKTDIEQNIINS